MRSTFIKVSTLFILLAASCTLKKPAAVQDAFYVGTYTDGESKGIYQYSLSAEGTVKQLRLAAGAENPSFLARSADGNFLLAVNENSDGAGGGGTVTSYRIIESGLQQVDQKPSGGAWPCYVSVNSTGYVLAANYGSGTVDLLKLMPDGILDGPLDVLQHTGKGTHPRQDAPHAHAAVFETEENVITVDLGTNELWFSTIDAAQNKLVHADQKIAMAPGAGPRHVAFHPQRNWIYVINELSATVTQLIKKDAGGYEVAGTISTLPEDFTGENFCADIHLSPDGNFLYASNRGHNSIAIFSVDEATGRLSLIGHEPVRGDWPRNFAITPDGEFLLVANQRSNNIVVFRRDQQNGLLHYVSEAQAPSPVCLVF